MLLDDPKQAARLGAHGRRLFDERCAIEALANRWSDVLDRAFKSRGEPAPCAELGGRPFTVGSPTRGTPFRGRGASAGARDKNGAYLDGPVPPRAISYSTSYRQHTPRRVTDLEARNLGSWGSDALSSLRAALPVRDRVLLRRGACRRISLRVGLTSLM